MKAAIDAESLADALTANGGDVAAALERYNAERQPYGAALVTRGRHIGALFRDRGGDRQQRIETLMREYGAAGLVRDQADPGAQSGLSFSHSRCRLANKPPPFSRRCFGPSYSGRCAFGKSSRARGTPGCRRTRA